MRIIPAYAGSTTIGIQATEMELDHPRIRGEHAATSIAKGEAGGSSPHTRGAHWGAGGWAGPRRIIPAYAGSTDIR